MRIGSLNVDKTDIKAMLQSLFITIAIILSYFLGRLASAYETSTVMNYLYGHPEYTVSVAGVRIIVNQTNPNTRFKTQWTMNNGTLEYWDNSSDGWGIWDPIA